MSQFLYQQASTQNTHRGDGSGGLKVPKEMQKLIDQPAKFLTLGMQGQRLRHLYVDNSRTFNASMLTWFGYCCYWGRAEDVIKAVEAGTAPDLEGTETPYKFGYISLVMAGAQRIRPLHGGDSSNLPHFEALKYLVKCGASVDLPDIVGYTALSHGTMQLPPIELCRFLLQSGANPNHQDRFGSVPLLNAFMKNSIPAIDLLMEFGADLKCGPEVTATVQRWMRKRTGNAKPMDTDACDHCSKRDTSLKICSQCHTVRYCSTTCQRSHWPAHKPNCHKGSTVTLKPFYDARHKLFPTAKFARDAMDIPAPETPAAHHRGARTPRNLLKGLIIKVQVPYAVFADLPTAAENSQGDLMVYTEKRNFVCRVRRCDGPAAYDRISMVVRTRGVGGAKAYFAAELKTKNELVVDYSEQHRGRDFGKNEKNENGMSGL
ncbi:hypothetical protein BDZ89DRAFT_1203585 [Hymenopellis radicata]|nr:hypothetical protein BDZ89DRAFT_1203585 [Hymenopellis radicata]